MRRSRALDELQTGSYLPDDRTLGTALRTETGAATGFARLFVVFLAAHFLLDAAALNQLTETTDCFLNRFLVPNSQLNHKLSFASENATHTRD